MKRVLTIIFGFFLGAILLMTPRPSQAAYATVSKIAADCTGTTSCTTTGNLTGDLEIAWACRDGSATAPTTPAGWTSPASWTGSINGTGAADSVCKTACKVATGANEASGTFTNAGSLMIQVYRGQTGGLTAVCATAIVGTPVFTLTTINTTSTTETFAGIAAAVDPNSWVVGFGYAPAATAGMGTAPAAMTNRNTNGTIQGGHDTNGTVSSYSTANVTITTASRIITAVIEVTPANNTAIAWNGQTCENSTGATPVLTVVCTPSAGFTTATFAVCHVRDDLSVDTPTVADAGGNTYTLYSTRTAGGWANEHSMMFYAPINSTSGNITMTTLLSDFAGVLCYPFTGVATSSFTDGHSEIGNLNSVNGENSGTPFTPTAAGDLLIVGQDNTGASPGSAALGYQYLSTTVTGPGVAFRIQSVAASYTPKIRTAVAGSGDLVINAMAFKVASTATFSPKLMMTGVGD